MSTTEDTLDGWEDTEGAPAPSSGDLLLREETQDLPSGALPDNGGEFSDQGEDGDGFDLGGNGQGEDLEEEPIVEAPRKSKAKLLILMGLVFLVIIGGAVGLKYWAYQRTHHVVVRPRHPVEPVKEAVQPAQAPAPIQASKVLPGHPPHVASAAPTPQLAPAPVQTNVEGQRPGAGVVVPAVATGAVQSPGVTVLPNAGTKTLAPQSPGQIPSSGKTYGVSPVIMSDGITGDEYRQRVREQFAKDEAKVTELSQTIASNDGKMDLLAKALSAQETAIGALTARVQALEDAQVAAASKAEKPVKPAATPEKRHAEHVRQAKPAPAKQEAPHPHITEHESRVRVAPKPRPEHIAQHTPAGRTHEAGQSQAKGLSAYAVVATYPSTTQPGMAPEKAWVTDGQRLIQLKVGSSIDGARVTKLEGTNVVTTRGTISAQRP